MMEKQDQTQKQAWKKEHGKDTLENSLLENVYIMLGVKKTILVVSD